MPTLRWSARSTTARTGVRYDNAKPDPGDVKALATAQRALNQENGDYIRKLAVQKTAEASRQRLMEKSTLLTEENAVGVCLKGDTAQISMDVTISVTNISGAAATFRAAVIGPAVE